MSMHEKCFQSYLETKLPFMSNGHQRKGIDIDTESLDKRTKFAHELRQIPSLLKGSVKLEGNAENRQKNVRKRQI